MKKYSPVFVLVGIFLITFFSCKKINESTELGSDLIPAVDNVKTFDTSLAVISNNINGVDSVRIASYHYVAAGHLSDPEFGTTHANFQFGIAPSVIGTYPYGVKDSAIIDSVVLSLGYIGGYGDTATASQTFRVFEISPTAAYRYDSSYRYDDPTTEFPTTGTEMASKTFQVRNLKDTITLTRGQDTIGKVVNALRIRLPNSFGERLKNYDTSFSSNGGYRSDSLFRSVFKGFAIKVDPGGNVLTYFSLLDQTRTSLTVYYQLKKEGGKRDTTSFSYYQTVVRDLITVTQGRTNYVNITPGNNWLAALQPSNPDFKAKMYLQGAPSGAYTSLVIPGLTNFGNKVIHRAELIVTRVPAAGDNIFREPERIYLDRYRTGSADTSVVFERDISIGADGSLSFTSFGGAYKNNGYLFNITRYVQGIVTRNERNDTLRLYAPFETPTYVPGYGFTLLPVAGVIYDGRVVLAGGDYPDPKARLKLRVIYSNL